MVSLARVSDIADAKTERPREAWVIGWSSCANGPGSQMSHTLSQGFESAKNRPLSADLWCKKSLFTLIIVTSNVYFRFRTPIA